MSRPNDTGADEHAPLLNNGGQPANAPVPPTITPATRPNTNSWPTPAGLPPAGPNDENLTIFRRALGINAQLSANDSPSSVEAGRRSAVGIYGAVIREHCIKSRENVLVSILTYAAHLLQIVLGAALTALGATSAAQHGMLITVLGAANTVVAGILALLRGQGQPERLRKDALEFRRLQDWIEETESLLRMGILGRDRREVGLLVELAFKKYNAAKASEENNKPDSWVRQQPEPPQDGAEFHEDLLRRADGGPLRHDEGLVPLRAESHTADDARSVSSSSGNALVKLNLPRHHDN